MLDYRVSAIRIGEYSDIWHGRGGVIRGNDNNILISCGEKIFHTDYDNGLFDLLKSIPSWEVKADALRGGISDAERPNIKMPLSSIVGAYHKVKSPKVLIIQQKMLDMFEDNDD